jgi:hypothetical protein
MKKTYVVPNKVLFFAKMKRMVQYTLDLRKPDLRKNLDLRKIVATTNFSVHKLFDLRKIFQGLMFDLRKIFFQKVEKIGTFWQF